jgi:hypothetical protein
VRWRERGMFSPAKGTELRDQVARALAEAAP